MSDVSTVPMGRRERKKQDTRRALKLAALSLARERGVEQLTVDEITEAADVSPRTFFNYFACKADALIGETYQIGAEIRDAILARPEGETPLATLRFALAQSELLQEAHAHRDLALARQRLIHSNPELLARQHSHAVSLETMIAEAMAVRLHADAENDFGPQLLAALASSVLRVALRHWTAAEGVRLDDLIDEGFSQLSSELGAPST